jgi:murein DD-endopeptidase MepM/ murein hydrolase activator NlpD
MPLLREERRASRLRRVVVGVAAIIVVAGGIASVFALPHLTGADGRETPSTPPPVAVGSAPADDGIEAPALPPIAGSEDGEGEPAEVEPAAPPVMEEASGTTPVSTLSPVTPGAVRRAVVRFGNARAFRPGLQAAGLSRDECVELEQALRDVLDFRRCRPEHEMVIERDGDGRLVLFEYHEGGVEFVRARRDGHGNLLSRRVRRPVDRTRLARGGAVRSSLGDALDQAGLGRSLVGAFLEVFEGKIDFTTDSRAGDTWRIIVDEERLDGELLRYGTVHGIEYTRTRGAGTLRAFWYEPPGGQPDFYDESGRAMHGGWLRPPLRYDQISSRFNPRRMHPILRRIVPHTGVDYAAGTGTPVWAAAAGTVTFAGDRGANGTLVALRHDGGYETYYAHLSRIASGIEPGVQVAQRQVIGAVGSTGRSTGPHLHFGLKRHGRFIDPLAELNGPGRMMPSGALSRYRRHVRTMTAALERIAAGAPPAASPPPADDGAEPAPAPADAPMD